MLSGRQCLGQLGVCLEQRTWGMVLALECVLYAPVSWIQRNLEVSYRVAIPTFAWTVESDSLVLIARVRCAHKQRFSSAAVGLHQGCLSD